MKQLDITPIGAAGHHHPPVDDNRLRDVDLPREGSPWSEEIPVSVNDTYGDPFIHEQVANTVAKLNLLTAQKRPIAIFTKAGPDDRVTEALDAVRRPENVIIFYSLTGLNEADISFEDRERMIEILRGVFPRVMVFARPIIFGRNDDPGTLSRIVDVARRSGLEFVLGGLHDRFKKKRMDGDVRQQLLEICDERGVPAFHKTSCAASWAFGHRCWVHDLGRPVNVDVARLLGYRLKVGDDEIVLERGTTGDINFLRMLCRTEVFVEDLISNYNVLTMPLRPGILMESTSSWFAWSENIETCLDCDYCIIKQIEYLRRKRVSVGVHPSQLAHVVDREAGVQVIESLKATKMDRQDRDRLHRYADLRSTTPCHTTRYPAPVGRP